MMTEGPYSALIRTSRMIRPYMNSAQNLVLMIDGEDFALCTICHGKVIGGITIEIPNSPCYQLTGFRLNSVRFAVPFISSPARADSESSRF